MDVDPEILKAFAGQVDTASSLIREADWGDGTQYVVDETPEGVRTAAFNMPDGRHGVLPPDSPLLAQTVPDRIGDVLTGLETHIDRGGRIPMLSMDTVEKVGAGAKYGGPALGVMSAMNDFLVAPTPADKCVSVFAGTFALAGNAGGAAGGAAAGCSDTATWHRRRWSRHRLDCRR